MYTWPFTTVSPSFSNTVGASVRGVSEERDVRQNASAVPLRLPIPDLCFIATARGRVR